MWNGNVKYSNNNNMQTKKRERKKDREMEDFEKNTRKRVDCVQ